jgi:hypothetical protein
MKTLSTITLARGQKLYALLMKKPGTSYQDMTDRAGWAYADTVNLLHRIRERPHEFGYEVCYAAHGPNPNDEKRYFARRIDGVKRPFTKEELEAYVAGERAKLRMIDTFSTNMVRMMRQFEQDFPKTQRSSRRAIIANMEATQATMKFLIEQAMNGNPDDGA